MFHFLEQTNKNKQKPKISSLKVENRGDLQFEERGKSRKEAESNR